MATTEVHRDDDQSRYEITIDGTLAGIADYAVVIFPHTEIYSSMRNTGQGQYGFQSARAIAAGHGA